MGSYGICKGVFFHHPAAQSPLSLVYFCWPSTLTSIDFGNLGPLKVVGTQVGSAIFISIPHQAVIFVEAEWRDCHLAKEYLQLWQVRKKHLIFAVLVYSEWHIFRLFIIYNIQNPNHRNYGFIWMILNSVLPWIITTWNPKRPVLSFKWMFG